MKIQKTAFLVVCLLSWAGAAAAQTADEVIEKSLAATGGRAAWAKVKSRAATGDITLSTPAGDIAGTVETLNVAPNKSRTVIQADLSNLGAGKLVLDQRFDGTSGYVLDSLQGNREMAGGQLENARNSVFPTPFLNYKEMGGSVALTGKDKVGDREVHVVTYTRKGGSTVRYFIDAETFMPLKTVSRLEVPQIGEVEQATEFADYRDVDGIKIPFQLKTSSNVQNFTIKLSRVEHNVSVDETLFSKPAK